MPRSPSIAPLIAAGVLSSVASAAYAQNRDATFDLGEIVVIGARPDGASAIGGELVTREQSWTFEKPTLNQAVNLVPGVVSTQDVNGRRNESDIFVRGFGRLQVPLSVDGVRIYLPADNRLDFGRFLTADIAAIQIQKGYASVIDGPGAMGGAINIVTTRPTEQFQADAGISLGGRDSVEGWTGYLLAGSRSDRYYVQGSVTGYERDSWSMSGDYHPVVNSLEDGGKRVSSDSKDWRINLKAGFTPHDGAEYAVNIIRQNGEKGAPLNVYTNPLVPPNSFWRWPYWDVENVSFHTSNRLGPNAYLKTKTYYNTFDNGLSAYDDITYATQSANGRFDSPYHDHAAGTSIEFGSTRFKSDTIKIALHLRTDVHDEQQTSRPTNPNPALRFTEPVQRQSQDTWSVAAENTFRASERFEVVGGISYDNYNVTKAQDYNATRLLFEYPRGGANAFNWQTALLWHRSSTTQYHVSISDRARFPTFFELYSTRFGTATPNPDLGPERATNLEVGWEKSGNRLTRIGGAVFYSDVEDLIQTVVLPDTTTQSQNVGNGHFYGVEAFLEVHPSDRLSAGGNITHIRRTITDSGLPNLRATGVPENKLVLYATWRPNKAIALTPSVEAADDRWSDKTTNPVTPLPYVQTGAYTLLNADATFRLPTGLELAVGLKNLLDENYELAWGYPEVGRTAYMKFRIAF